MLTTLFLADIRSNAASRITSTFTHGGIGTDATTPTPADTTLRAEVFRDARDDLTDTGTGIVTASLRVLSTEANGNTVREVGWFDALVAGEMKVRNTITAINKTSDIQLFLDAEITIAVEEV